jgi:hypothetical protein
MAKKWTLEELKGMSVHQRAELYKNAARLGHTPEGAELKAQIEAAGLPYSDDVALKGDDPITLAMIKVVYSPEGREAAVSSTKAGEAAMAGVDPLLQVALGVDYGPHNFGTNRAGEIVGALMRSLGYKKGPDKDLPSHCVAKTAATWV